jgi:hypothetical protein
MFAAIRSRHEPSGDRHDSESWLTIEHLEVRITLTLDDDPNRRRRSARRTGTSAGSRACRR